MPSPTYVALAKTVLTGTQTTITFSSIPSTYTDLILLVSARVDQAANTQAVILRFNGDTGTNYSNRRVYGPWNGSALVALSSQLSTTDFIRYYAITGDSSTSNSFASSELYIPNYAGSTYKQIGYSYASESNDTTKFDLGATAGLWSSTSAITSITLQTQANNFVSGSRFDLYGIKSSS